MAGGHALALWLGWLAGLRGEGEGGERSRACDDGDLEEIGQAGNGLGLGLGLGLVTKESECDGERTRDPSARV